MVGQMDDDAVHGALEPRPKLEQSLAQRRDLGRGAPGTRSTEAKFLHQHVGGYGEHHPQVVGPELGAARAVNCQTVP